MAKAPAKVSEEKSNVPATTGEYDYGQYAGAGNDMIDAADTNIPRLKLVQAMSPEAKDGLAAEGDVIHSITRQVIAQKGQKIAFVPIMYQKEYILWRDRKQGGGIMARARKYKDSTGAVRYKWDQPNTTFEDKIDGKRPVKYTTKVYIDEDGLSDWGSQIPGEKDSGPAATETHNFLVMLPDHGNQIAALSLSRTGTKKAKDLNFMIKTATSGGTPIFALKFEAASIMETGGGNTYANYAFAPSGKLPPNDPLFKTAAEAFKSFSAKGFTVDAGDDGAETGSRQDDGKF